MTQFIRYYILGLLAAVLLMSCGTDVSITKRRYNKGYHIDHGRDNSNAPAKKPKSIEKKTIRQVVADAPARDSNVYISKEPETASVETPTSPVVKHEMRPWTGVKDEAPVWKPSDTLSTVSTFTNIDHERGLSLLWIVILLIIILWILGILSGGFGMGGLIHLLGVIALILLILWLLRII